MTGSGLPLRKELRTRAARVTPLLQSPNRQTRYQQKYQVGITERAAHRIVVELADAGYITRERNGRRNHYTINAHFPLPDPIACEQKVGELLAILTGPPATSWRGGRSQTSA